MKLIWLTSQNNNEYEIGAWKGSTKCKPVVMGKKIKLWEMENFYLILEVSNLLTYELYDETGPSSAERNVMREEGGKTTL